MKPEQHKLTNLQQELLKLFSYDLSERQLTEVKSLLSKFFADMATKEMDEIWEKKGLDNAAMDKWLEEHMRTSYK